jgi:copper chaperone NosL
MRLIPRVMVGVGALIMIVIYYVPFWQILMWAPQYPEGLTMKIWIDRLSGDVEIINGLNHYIGMKHIKVEMFPEFRIMPWLVGSLAALGLIAAITGKKIITWLFLLAMIITGIIGLVDFWLWGYDYGHNLDPTAPIQIPGFSYQPPLIGSKQLLNFLAYSGPDTGAWIMVTTVLMTIAALYINYRFAKK